MNREQAKELLPIIKPFGDGKTIQFNFASGWEDVDKLNLTDDPKKYRIKPEPRVIYVSFSENGALLNASKNSSMANIKFIEVIE